MPLRVEVLMIMKTLQLVTESCFCF